MPVGLHILHSAKEVYRKMVMASIEAILMVVLCSCMLRCWI